MLGLETFELAPGEARGDVFSYALVGLGFQGEFALSPVFCNLVG